MNKTTLSQYRFTKFLNKSIRNLPECSRDEAKAVARDFKALMLLVVGETDTPRIYRHNSCDNQWTIHTEDWMKFITESDFDRALYRLIFVHQMLEANHIITDYSFDSTSSFTFAIDKQFHNELRISVYSEVSA